jgi:hypothetical protein
MLSYQGMGQTDNAAKEQKLYMRFKADESSQALTGNYRKLHPEDNNERQPIHQHESAPLKGEPLPAVKRGVTVSRQPISRKGTHESSL